MVTFANIINVVYNLTFPLAPILSAARESLSQSMTSSSPPPPPPPPVIVTVRPTSLALLPVHPTTLDCSLTDISSSLLAVCPVTSPSVHHLLWCPELGALPGRCPGVQGRGSHGPSGWSQTLSYGGPSRDGEHLSLVSLTVKLKVHVSHATLELQSNLSTSFQMTVSDSPVVLDVPTEKINLRSHATRSSLSTWQTI